MRHFDWDGIVVTVLLLWLIIGSACVGFIGGYVYVITQSQISVNTEMQRVNIVIDNHEFVHSYK